jgi:mannose-6-phosphate isomerase-like protein (cupin superfamily)
MTDSGAEAAIVAGIGMTRLSVYTTRTAPDGVMSGCPHVHAITDEAYFVVGGFGSIELHDPVHGFRTVDLGPGGFVQFTPGTLHRVISRDRLEVLVVMGNAGLAEKGDARIYFGADVDADEAAYAALWGLAQADGLDGALRRRDAAVTAYGALMALWRDDRAAYRAELMRFNQVHERAMAARRARLAAVVEEGPARWLRLVETRIERLAAGGLAAQASALPGATDAAPVLGMCGLLHPVQGLSPV